MLIGLIGVGRIGAFHAQTLTDLPAVDELIVTDAVPDLAERIGERLDVSVAPEPADVLAAGVDGVVIASSTGTHPDLVRAFARAGIPTFCEKPVAASANEAVALRDELSSNGTPIQIGLPAPVRRRLHAGAGGDGHGSPRLRPHRPFDDAGPGASAGDLHPSIGWHLQRLRDPRRAPARPGDPTQQGHQHNTQGADRKIADAMEALIAREVEAKPSNQADDDSADDPDDDPDDGGADVLAPVG